jgi:hypothetical protein
LGSDPERKCCGRLLDSAGIVLDPDDAFEVEWLHDQRV